MLQFRFHPPLDTAPPWCQKTQREQNQALGDGGGHSRQMVRRADPNVRRLPHLARPCVMYPERTKTVGEGVVVDIVEFVSKREKWTHGVVLLIFMVGTILQGVALLMGN